VRAIGQLPAAAMARLRRLIGPPARQPESADTGWAASVLATAIAAVAGAPRPRREERRVMSPAELREQIRAAMQVQTDRQGGIRHGRG